ncbi:hypothetical protein ACFLTU_02625 [Bacteroidota bacterium]
MIASILVLTGCPTPKVLPDVPRVEYQSFILSEKTSDLGSKILTGELTFYFEDGDGDIGFHASLDSLSQPDSVKYNLFLTIHQKVDGVYNIVDTSELETKPFYRIPPLDREGQNKTLKGEIEVAIEYYTINYDTIKYSFYLRDRAYNRSNTDTTEEVIFIDWME